MGRGSFHITYIYSRLLAFNQYLKNLTPSPRYIDLITLLIHGSKDHPDTDDDAQYGPNIWSSKLYWVWLPEFSIPAASS